MANLRQVRVVYRDRASERAWMVEIDPNASLDQLLPDLVETLELGDDAANFLLTVEGSVNSPVLVINARRGGTVGKATPIDYD